MKKTARMVAVVGLTLAIAMLVSGGTALGTGARTGGVILQNIDPSGDSATILLEFYNQAGDVVATEDVDLDQYAAAGVNAGKVTGLDPGFAGSVVVSASGRIGAVANDTDDTTIGMYNGFSEGGTEFYLPAIYNGAGGWTTEIWIQTTEDVSGVSSPQADITYMDRAGAVAGTDTIDLTTNATILVDPNDTVPTGFAGGVVISSAHRVAAVARFSNGDITEIYNGFAGGDSNVYAPALYKDAGGWHSGIMVQNLGPGSTGVSIDFYDREGNQTGTYTFPDAFVENGVQAISTRNIPDSTVPAGWAGTAVISSDNDNPIIAVIDATNRASGLGNVYNGALESDASTVAYVPAQYKRAGGWTSGVIAMNIDGTATDITFDYYDRDTQALTESVVKQGVGQNIAFALNTIRLEDAADGWAGSVRVSTSNASRVVAVANVTGSGKTAMYSAFPDLTQ